MRRRILSLLPVVWLCIGLTVSAQTMSGENGSGDRAQTSVTAYVSNDIEETTTDRTDDSMGTDGKNENVDTGDHTKHVLRLMLICSGTLMIAAVIIGRQEKRRKPEE